MINLEQRIANSKIYSKQKLQVRPLICEKESKSVKACQKQEFDTKGLITIEEFLEGGGLKRDLNSSSWILYQKNNNIM